MNNNRFLTEKNFIQYFLIGIIFFGFYLCFIGGYGSDEDTLPLIYVFEQRLSTGQFATSRFTGYPVPEIGIGFLSYYIGSWAASSITFIFLVLGLILIFISLSNQQDYKNINIFLLLCLSNPIIFFDNLEPIDYSWALFFFSLGLYCLKKNFLELSIIFFGICIGSRLNFVPFIIFAIYFFPKINYFTNLRKISLILSSIFIGGLFYIPIWMENSFSLGWIAAGRPLEQGLFGLAARFFYKSYLSFGGLIGLYLIIIFYLNKHKIKKLKTNKLIFLVCFSNLLIFFWIPAELSYLQLFIVLIYFLLNQIVKLKFILILIILNLTTWILNVGVIKIEHKYKDKCKPIQAISAKIYPHLKQGYFMKFIDSRDMIKCWINTDSERGKRIIEGKSIKKYK